MNYSERDSVAVWHPYTQMHLAEPATPIVRAEGAYLYNTEGQPIVDAISSWWVNIHGHGHPYIAEKVYQQIKTLDHVLFAGFTHPTAIELAERLLTILPTNQRKIFYSDNGSTAVEVALKMCVQYWHNLGKLKHRVIYFEGAYHGDTFGAMASSARSAFTKPFQSMFFDTTALPLPNATNFSKVVELLTSTLAQGDVSCFLFEPLVQGAGGFRFYDGVHLSELIHICRSHDVLTIADEVMTGFGRTGSLFATNSLTDSPDIICLSKGITGGVMPLAVTSCTQHVYDAFLSEDRNKAFFHGHSYTANPVACAAACASLDLLETATSMEQRSGLSMYLLNAALRLKDRHGLSNVRCLGNIFAADMVNDQQTSYFNTMGPQIAKFFLQRGVLIRPLGNIFYLMPPYCINTSQLNHIFDVLEEFLIHAK
jgi:adenosylmethionine-8-amino-7-oxononanoate aminotransferase